MASVFPARAGMILSSELNTLKAWGIPRESGDDPREPFESQAHE